MSNTDPTLSQAVGDVLTGLDANGSPAFDHPQIDDLSKDIPHSGQTSQETP